MTPSEEKKLWQKAYDYVEAKSWTQAETCLNRLVKARPTDTLYTLNLARTQTELGRTKQALDTISPLWEKDRSDPLIYKTAITIARDFGDFTLLQFIHETYQGLIEDELAHRKQQATDYSKLNRHDAALEVLMKCSALKPDDADLHYQIAGCLYEMEHIAEAMEAFKTSELIGNDKEKIRALHQRTIQSLYACYWPDLDKDIARLTAVIQDHIARKEHIELGLFNSLWMGFNGETIRQIAEMAAAKYTTENRSTGIKAKKRYRIGYLSDDFANHAVNHLLINLLEHQKNATHEYIIYSYAKDDKSDYYKRVENCGLKVQKMVGWTAEQMFQRIRKDKVDILIDLKGYTGDLKMSVHAMKPAPISIGFLGYPSTTGARFIDYILGDPICTPAKSAYQHTEKIAQMPNCYMPTDTQRAIPKYTTRAAQGLPETGFIFCSFNQSYKINPQVLDAWCDILKSVPDSVLWLSVRKKSAEDNLKREFNARGVAPERIVFAPKVATLEEHQGRYAIADLFLDTWPFGGHTTACEALWSNLPVLAAPGENFTSRVGASLAYNCGLPDLICADTTEYIAKAIHLGLNPGISAKIKTDLMSKKLSLPLFDIKTYAANFDILMSRIIKQHLDNNCADHILAADCDEWKTPLVE